jgi:hypothetical protein
MLNREFLLFFVLAHLIGDYALQTDKIAKIKSEGVKGVAVHTFLVCLAQLMLLSIFGVRGVAAALLGAGIHFMIDCLKLFVGKRFKNIELPYYFFDQGLHLIVIILLTMVFAPEKSVVGSYVKYAGLLVGLILILFTATVTAKNVVRNFFPDMKTRRFFESRERGIDALAGVLLYVAYLIHPLLSLVVLAAGAYVYCRIQAAVYRYRFPVSVTKYVTLVLFSYLAIWIAETPFIALLN